MGRKSKAAQQATQNLGWTNQWSQGIDSSGALIPLISGISLMYDLKRMFLTDDTVGAMVWMIISTLRQVEYRHVPQVDGLDAPDDEEAKKWADFADSLLTDMKENFSIHASEIVNILWAGFVPFEIILKQRDGKRSRYDDGYYGVDRVPLRDPLTVANWRWDEATQEVVAMIQIGAKDELPIWKLLVYAIGASDANPQGIPLLTPAWRSWRLKIRVQDSEAIGIERDLCGLPMFRYPEELLEQANAKENGEFTEDALAAQQKIAAAISAVKDMRFNRSGGLVLPSDTFSDDTPTDKTPKYDFKLVTTAGQRTIDTRTVARDYDKSIARTLLMQFLHLGDRSTGSYALSDDQSSMGMRSLQALANIPAEEWTAKVLPLVWDLNNFPVRYRPRLGAGKVSKENMTALGAYLRGLGAILDLVKDDEDARNELLEAGGIRPNRKRQKAAAERAVKAAELEAEQPKLPGLPAPQKTPAKDA